MSEHSGLKRKGKDLDRLIVSGDEIEIHHKDGEADDSAVSSSGRTSQKRSSEAQQQFHGTPGRPGYPSLHPSGKNKHPSPENSVKTPGGSVLGSNRFTEEEHLNALTSYNGRGYQDMNGVLRRGDGEVSSPLHLEEVRRKNSALMDLINIQEPTASATTLYRAMRAPRRPVFTLQPGDEFHDKGFLSTTSDPDTAQSLAGRDEKSVMFTIITPAGTQMADMNALRGMNSPERELILLPGSKFKVRRVLSDDREDEDDSGPVHYELELINE